MKRKDLPERVGLFFSYNRKALFFQIAPTNVQHCTWLGYRPLRPVGETGGRYHLGESEPQRLIFQIAPTNVQHCTWLGFCLPPAARDSGRQNHLGE